MLTDLAATTAGVHRMSVFRPLSGEVSLHMDAPPEEVWALVSDVTRIGEFSPETFEAQVDPRLDRPRGGRVVQGPREAQRRRADVLVAVPGHQVRAERGLRVRGRHRRRDASTTGATGSSPTDGGTRVTEYFRLEPTLPLRLYWLAARASCAAAPTSSGMRTTLERMKAGGRDEH